MIKTRDTFKAVHMLERLCPSGYYKVTVMPYYGEHESILFDSGKEAHQAFKLSPETFKKRFG